MFSRFQSKLHLESIDKPVMFFCCSSLNLNICLLLTITRFQGKDDVFFTFVVEAFMDP
jgi:hypothetical protein